MKEQWTAKMSKVIGFSKGYITHVGRKFALITTRAVEVLASKNVTVPKLLGTLNERILSRNKSRENRFFHATSNDFMDDQHVANARSQ